MRAPEPIAAEFFCAACRTPFLNSFPLDAEGLCGICRTGVRAFDRAYCYGSYDGALKELIHLFKYGRAKGLAIPFAKYLSAALPVDSKFDVVVPVPLHWRRRWQRGFNQADLLGRQIARRRGLKFAKLLTRNRWTGSQASLANSARRTNVSGAFRTRGGSLAGLRILLVDDVMTTGATASACALVLKRAGAKSVTLLTLARVDRRLAALSARNSVQGAS